MILKAYSIAIGLNYIDMKKSYIAVFYEYDSALRFCREYLDKGIKATIIPVPRRLNAYSKFGVRFDEDESFTYYGDPYKEVEQIARINGNKFDIIYDSEEDE